MTLPHMSTRTTINLSAVAAVLAVITTVGGGIWAVSARDSDIAELKDWQREVKVKVDKHNDEISDVKSDLRVIKSTVERIDKKIP